MESFKSLENNYMWIVFLTQSLLCILLVTYCIILSSNVVTVPKSKNTNLKSSSNNQSSDIQDEIPKDDSPNSPINKNKINNNDSIRKIKKSIYRIDEEGTKKTSSEYTRRGMLWSRHASWHLPSAPKPIITSLDPQGLEHIIAILKKYDVDPLRGFLPSQDPLQRLPYARYHLWYQLKYIFMFIYCIS